MSDPVPMFRPSPNAPEAARTKRVAFPVVAFPVLLAALALGACGAPRHPAGNDRDGTITQRAVEKPTHMATTHEMMQGTTNSKAYPPSATIPATTTYPAPMSYPATYPVTAYPVTAPITASRAGTSESAADLAFAQQAMSISAAEVAMARMAYVRARAPEVRNFARQMLVEHRLAATEIDNFALERGHIIEWPLTAEDQAAIDRLRLVDAAAFDRAYVDEIVRAHERAEALLRSQSTGAGQAAVIARNTLPGVQQHLTMARDLQLRL